MTLPAKGASIYDVRSGWREVVGPQKADERNKIS